jgi:hypothetical protein
MTIHLKCNCDKCVFKNVNCFFFSSLLGLVGCVFKGFKNVFNIQNNSFEEKSTCLIKKN